MCCVRLFRANTHIQNFRAHCTSVDAINANLQVYDTVQGTAGPVEM